MAYFYPRPPRGGRLRRGDNPTEERKFLSTPSARRATVFFGTSAMWPKSFLSTPSARRATQDWDTLAKPCRISIHALREEGDRATKSPRSNQSISIHALREEGDKFPHIQRRRQNNFYPRPPRGGRLSGRAAGVVPLADFYPRPPRGGRLFIVQGCELGQLISIHALREEGDTATSRQLFIVFLFLSTPSARRATAGEPVKIPLGKISIHALREEGDTSTDEQAFGYQISIHALREEGDSAANASALGVSQFLSTPSARRATAGGNAKHHAEGNFYPRPPRGGRRE